MAQQLIKQKEVKLRVGDEIGFIPITREMSTSFSGGWMRIRGALETVLVRLSDLRVVRRISISDDLWFSGKYIGFFICGEFELFRGEEFLFKRPSGAMYFSVGHDDTVYLIEPGRIDMLNLRGELIGTRESDVKHDSVIVTDRDYMYLPGCGGVRRVMMKTGEVVLTVTHPCADRVEVCGPGCFLLDDRFGECCVFDIWGGCVETFPIDKPRYPGITCTLPGAGFALKWRARDKELCVKSGKEIKKYEIDVAGAALCGAHPSGEFFCLSTREGVHFIRLVS